MVGCVRVRGDVQRCGRECRCPNVVTPNASTCCVAEQEAFIEREGTGVACTGCVSTGGRCGPHVRDVVAGLFENPDVVVRGTHTAVSIELRAVELEALDDG